MNLFQDVGAFHAKFKLPTTSPFRPAALLSEEIFQYRLKFLQEELAEVIVAHTNADLVEFADALIDLTWVVLGTAHFAGLPFDHLWPHVRAANMKKVLAPPEAGEHKRGAVELIRKPLGWVPPNAMINYELRTWNRSAQR